MNRFSIKGKFENTTTEIDRKKKEIMQNTSFIKTVKNNHFLEWLAKEFSDMSAYMTTEEIADFVFGNVEEAVEKYKEQYGMEK